MCTTRPYERRSVVLAASLAVAFVLLSVMGVGTIAMLSLVAIALCVVGLFQRQSCIDWWILCPLLIYLAFSAASSIATYGNAVLGFASTQLIFPILYVLSGCLPPVLRVRLRQCCVLIVSCAAVFGIAWFATSSFLVTVSRLEVVVGSPNALAIYFVLGWFALAACQRGADDMPGRLTRLLGHAEPLILVALALTLSMGAFLALVVGAAIMTLAPSNGEPLKARLRHASAVFAKLVVGLAAGLIMYMAGERAELPAMCVFMALYAGTLAIFWPAFEAFLESRRRTSLVICALGFLCAALALVLRPSSIATFSERLLMMKNGLGYLGTDPLLGLGPYTWRAENLADSDIYFNTNHIHNAYLHVGVELGIIAMVALVVITVRCFVALKGATQRGECSAFLVHMLLDTGFFFVGVVSMFMLTVGSDSRTGQTFGRTGLRVFCVAMIICYLYLLITYVEML